MDSLLLLGLLETIHNLATSLPNMEKAEGQASGMTAAGTLLQTTREMYHSSTLIRIRW